MKKVAFLAVLVFSLLIGVSHAAEMVNSGKIKTGVGDGMGYWASTDTDIQISDGSVGSPAATVLSIWQYGVSRVHMGSKSNSSKFYITNAPSGSVTIGTLANSIALDASGNLGIGVDPASVAKLDVNGTIQLRGSAISSAPTPSANSGLIYANTYSSAPYSDGPGIYAQWGSTFRRITSHADPRQIAPEAKTSFADLSVALPFSFAHKDKLVGKGAVVDMSKMIKYIEGKMQRELGLEEGKLTFTYDLPDCDKISLANWQVDNAIAMLDEMPWIKVQLGSDGSIPATCVEQVEEIIEQPATVQAQKMELDLENMKVVTKSIPQTVVQRVKTGRMVKKLKVGWEMREDGLYRRPTVEDLGKDKLQTITDQIPRWIMDRIQPGKQISMDVKQFADQLRQLVAENKQTSREAAQVVK